MIQLAFSLLLDAVCLALWIGPTEWMFRRGWRVWPRLYAAASFMFLSLMPIFAVLEMANNNLKMFAFIWAAGVAFACFALIGPVLKGIKPMSAGKEVKNWATGQIDKRVFPLIVCLPGIAVGMALHSIGVLERTAITISCYIAFPCWAIGQYLVPTRRAKAVRKYGSPQYIRVTLTRPVIATLLLIYLLSAALAYSIDLEPEELPLLALSGPLLVWRWLLRPIREGEYDFFGEMSVWAALDIVQDQKNEANAGSTLALPATSEEGTQARESESPVCRKEPAGEIQRPSHSAALKFQP